MKESFVFHAEYIEDLSERYKADFMRYTVNYGLYGEIPPLDENTLEYSLWKKIARRIDAEAGHKTFMSLHCGLYGQRVEKFKRRLSGTSYRREPWNYDCRHFKIRTVVI